MQVSFERTRNPSSKPTDQLADNIEDGAVLALAPDYSGCSLATIKAFIKKGLRGLHLIGCPQLGLQADLLIAAGCVKSLETAAIGLGEAGRAPAFDAAYRKGELRVLESTCPAIHSGLQAAEKGLSFMPVASILGTDLPKARPDWQIVQDPFSGDLVLCVPAIRPDIALFHAPVADCQGAVWIGVRRELMLLAHAAARTFVTVETIQSENLLRDTQKAAGTIPSLYITQVTEVPNGAHPNGLYQTYPADRAWLARYLDIDSTARRQFVEDWAAA